MSVTVTFVGSGDAFSAGGRFQTCFMVDAPGFRYVIDFGATSMVALQKLGIDHTTIDAVVLSHIHGDHCGGLPFFLMDSMLGAKRTRPLVIAGPRDTQARIGEICEALMPGMRAMSPKFQLSYAEMPLMQESKIGPLTVTPYPAAHTGETNPTSLRTEIAGKVVSYTGDSAWTRHMPAVARDADLFICECYFYGKPIKFHMNYPDIVEHRNDLTPKRMILTHFSREMMPHKDEVPEDTDYDGLVLNL